MKGNMTQVMQPSSACLNIPLYCLKSVCQHVGTDVIRPAEYRIKQPAPAKPGYRFLFSDDARSMTARASAIWSVPVQSQQTTSLTRKQPQLSMWPWSLINTLSLTHTCLPLSHKSFFSRTNCWSLTLTQLDAVRQTISCPISFPIFNLHLPFSPHKGGTDLITTHKSHESRWR